MTPEYDQLFRENILAFTKAVHNQEKEYTAFYPMIGKESAQLGRDSHVPLENDIWGSVVSSSTQPSADRSLYQSELSEPIRAVRSTKSGK